MDSIEIRDLELYCHHGVFKEENVLGQKFLVTLVLYMDTRSAGKTDDLNKSINYAEVAQFVKREMEQKNFRLLEAVAERLARQILLHFSRIQRVSVEIKKPWAPILLPLDTVSVCIERGWTTAYLSLGSNMGDREQYIKDAVEALRGEPAIRDVRISDLMETDPYGYTDQPPFLNAAVELQTLEDPQQLLRICQKIEEMGKRERTIHWGPRTIDLDILLFGTEVVQTESLMIPHREMHKRCFVLEPLAQIAPWVQHPVLGQRVVTLLENLKEKQKTLQIGGSDDRFSSIEKTD